VNLKTEKAQNHYPSFLDKYQSQLYSQFKRRIAMKALNKIGLIFVCTLVLMLNLNIAYAGSDNSDKTATYDCPQIPEPMQASSVIEYVDNHTVRVKEGGFISNNTSKNLSEKGMYSKPVKGMVVKYATDGYILEIINPNEPNRQTMKKLHPAPPMSANESPALLKNSGAALYASSTWILDHTWGSYSNKLYHSSYNANTKRGVGRATTYNDTIGQSNITLKKGDVATHITYDNCSVHRPVNVYAKNSSGTEITVGMTKNDAGSLPNAVIDIWKTGVAYWGYTWSSSFSMPGTTTYIHE
jgi:hypothetical protein